MAEFDYSQIPIGYYDQILKGPDGIRKFWHFHKFESVERVIPSFAMGPDKSILDIGCFSGSFLGMLRSEQFGHQLGVDILSDQVSYAHRTYGNEFRSFRAYSPQTGFASCVDRQYDVVTLIEVIEHLNQDDVRLIFQDIEKILKPEGILIITTPNYMSLWPALEILLHFMSDVSYEEQHITKFNFLNFEQKLLSITKPNIRLIDITTTHFLTPFIAGVSYEYATKLAQAVPSSKWHNPFGSIIVSSWCRANVDVAVLGRG